MGFNGYVNRAMEADETLPTGARSSHTSSGQSTSTIGIKTQEEFNEDFNYHKSNTNRKYKVNTLGLPS